MNAAADAATAAALMAVDPLGLGGVWLRAAAGPERDDWLAQLRGGLPAGCAWRRVPLHIRDAELLGGLDLAASLREGRAIARDGLLLQAHAGLGLAAGAVALVTLGPPRRPVPEQHPGHDPARAVRAAVVGDERVVALQPPAAAGRPDRPLDHEQVGTAREAGDDQVARPYRCSGTDEECVPVPQGRHHRRADHQHPAEGPAE